MPTRPTLTLTRRQALAGMGAAASAGLFGCASPLPTWPIQTTHVSENQDSRVLFLVMHYTACDFETALRVLTRPSPAPVSSHYLLRDEPVEVYRLVDESRRAWHSGPSYWKGNAALNASSIGIEIVNLGRVNSPDGPRYLPYPAAQIDALIELTKGIVARHEIRPERILGHNEVLPEYKTDPGPLFPWRRLADEGLIPWPDPGQVAAALEGLQSQTPSVQWFQDRLAEHGFRVPKNGTLDDATRRVMVAFQMRYRPTGYSGDPDLETAALLKVATTRGGMRVARRSA